MLTSEKRLLHFLSVHLLCLLLLLFSSGIAWAQAECQYIGDISDFEPDSDADLGLPIFLTSMIHLEGDSRDDEARGFFLQTVEYLDDAMDLAESYCAVQTIESEQPFARASSWWNRQVLRDVLLRGHGVGTHCDVGFELPTPGFVQYVRDLRTNKGLVDRLVGSDNNTGCSGAGGELDWVNGLSDAGFTYVNGVVGMHYLAVPLGNRPDGYTDTAIRTEGLHHNQVPIDLLDRTYLRTLKNTMDLEHDEDGILVLSSGSLGKLQGIEEGSYWSEADLDPVEDVELSLGDVDALVELIESIDEDRDRSRVSKITIMSHAQDWDQSNLENRVVMEYFLRRMKILADQGTIQWAAEKQVVDIYLEIMN